MKKIAIVLISLFTFVIWDSRYSVNDIDMKKISEIQIIKFSPKEGEDNLVTGDKLAIINEKSEISNIVNAIENAKKEDKNLGYEEAYGIKYEIKIFYEGSPQMGFIFWIEQEWRNAVFVNMNYYYMSEEITKKLKDIIYK